MDATDAGGRGSKQSVGRVGGRTQLRSEPHRRGLRDGVSDPFAGQCDEADLGYGGDGGPAIDALLADPSGVAIDPYGDVFVADTGNHILRRVVP
jgi:hypothetical protein